MENLLIHLNAMEYSLNAGSWKLERLISRRPQTRFGKAPAYSYDCKRMVEVKEILKKYIQPSEQKSTQLIESTLFDLKTLKKQRKKRLSPNKCSTAAYEKPIIDAMKIHSRSPILRIRKSKSKPLRAENHQSLRIQKLSYSKFVPSLKSSTKPIKSRQENSCYSSYSDIYRGLLERIPLQ